MTPENVFLLEELLKESMAELQRQNSVVSGKLAVFEFDEPDKYIQIARAKLISANNSVSWSSEKQAPVKKKRSVLRWLTKQWSVAPEPPVADWMTNDPLLTTDQYLAIYPFFPPRFQVGRPDLVYCSAEHGISIQTFLHRMEHYPASLIVIRTAKHEVFGAFCSGTWATRKESNTDLKFFGLGETFLFSCLPESRIYPWVGWTSPDANDVPGNKCLFLAANLTTLVIGGGGGDNGIRFVSDLSRGYTGSCTTFNNNPLCSSKDFLVSVVECYGFNS